MDVSHAAKKDFRILHLERSQSADDGVLGPALRVGLLRVFKEAVERFQKVGSESGKSELAREVGRLGDDEIVTLRQGFAERFGAGFLRCFTKGFERSDLCLEGSLAGHEGSVS